MGIQINIRVYDPDSRQIRESFHSGFWIAGLTPNASFTPRWLAATDGTSMKRSSVFHPWPWLPAPGIARLPGQLTVGRER